MKQTTTFNLSNKNGVSIEFMSLGGRVTSVKLPNKNQPIEISLGYDTIKQAIEGDGYMGAICGRVANRLGNGKFVMEGRTYKLAQNDRTNHLHGGPEGFHSRIWEVKEVKLENYTSAYKLSYISADGEEGYPGNLSVEIIYALNNNNEFLIDIQATTDKTTVVNLTSHPYFNLNGVGGGKIFNHELLINADSFTPLNQLSIPTGEIRHVKGTDMDFQFPVKLADRISSEYAQINHVGGLDHNWVINKKHGEIALACSISEPESGRAIEVYTTQPGIQVYTSMHFDGSEIGRNEVPFTQYCGIALEAQNFPDAPNKPNFPSSVLTPGEKYHEKIIYKFIF